jgi:multiple sugar transport system substrate-binding protein
MVPESSFAEKNPFTRRKLLGGSVAFTAGSLASACGQPAATIGGGASGKPLAQASEIDFYHRWDGVREPLMAAQIEDFKKIQPNIKINQSMVIGSGEGFYDGMPYDKIITMLAAGNPPDVIMVDVRTTADFAGRNALQFLDSMLTRDKISLQETFYPASVSLAQFNGRTPALPQVVTGASHILFMNVDVWQASGLDVKRPPKTWEELIDVAQKLTRRSGSGFDQVAGVFPSGFKMWATANAVPWISADRKRILFNTTEAVDALQYQLDSTNRLYGSNAALGEWYRNVGGATAAGRQVTGGYAAFLTNKQAIDINGNWQPFQYSQDAPQLKFAAAMLPHNGKNPRAKSANLADGGWNYGMMAGSKKQDAAWEWLKYITAGEGNAKFFKAQGRPSVVRKYNDAPDLKRLEYWDVLVKTMESATAIPVNQAWARVDRLFGTMQSKVLSGEMAPKAAVEEHARLAQEELDQANR